MLFKCYGHFHLLTPDGRTDRWTYSHKTSSCGSCDTVYIFNTYYASTVERFGKYAFVYLIQYVSVGVGSIIKCWGDGGGDRFFQQSFVPVLHTSGQIVSKYVTKQCLIKIYHLAQYKTYGHFANLPRPAGLMLGKAFSPFCIPVSRQF